MKFSGNKFIRFSFFTISFLTTVLVSGCGGRTENVVTEDQSRRPPISTPAVVFSGYRATYSITKVANGYIVVNNLTLVAQSVIGSPILKFDDASVDLSMPDKSAEISTRDLNNIIELYVAFFNRVPDAEGLKYWIDQFKNGVSIEAIADNFYSAAIAYSSVTGYSATMSNQDFVKIIYKNVLGRDAVDPEGLHYWEEQLASKQSSRAKLLNIILSSAHSFKGNSMFGWVADLLDNKVIIARRCAIDLGITYNSPQESISNGMAIVDAISPTDITSSMKLIDSNKYPIFNLLFNGPDSMASRDQLAPRTLSDFVASINRKASLGFQYRGEYAFSDGYFSIYSRDLSKFASYFYASFPSETSKLSFLALVNEQGKKGFKYWSDYYLGPSMSSIFFQNKLSEERYSYKALTPAMSSAEFLAQANNEGAAGSRYLGNYMFADGTISLYVKNDARSGTFSYLVTQYFDSSSEFLSKANELGAQGFRFIGPRAFKDGGFSIFVRDNAKNDQFSYKIQTITTSQNDYSGREGSKVFLEKLNENGILKYSLLGQYVFQKEFVNILIAGSSFEINTPFGS